MITTAAVMCLALNVYHESRGESTRGQMAVALVTLNRVNSKHYPNNTCDVVYQKYQFEWTRKNKSPVTYGREWRESLYVAKLVSNGNFYDFTHGAVYFNTINLKVRWKTNVKPLTIDNHIFY